MEQVSVSFRPRIPSTSYRDIQPLYNPLPMFPLLPNPEEKAAVLVLSVVEMATEVAESVSVSDVVEVEVVEEAEAVEAVVKAVVAAHKF